MSTATGTDTREVITSIYQAIAAGDIDTFKSYLADDVVIIEQADHPYPCRLEGIDNCMEGFGALAGAIGLSGIEIHQIFTDGNDGVGRITISCTNGKGEVRKVDVLERWCLNDEGKVNHVEPVYADVKGLVDHMAA